MKWISRCSLILLLLESSLHAGEITIAAPAAVNDLEYVEPVLAPAAKVAAVCDHARLIAVGYRPDKAQQLTLHRLDAQGAPAGDPVPVKLPFPAALKDRPSYPTGLTFHPRLPLLYVWRDLAPLMPPKPDDPAYKEFDHLLIYSVEGPQPELLLSLCRGPGFAVGATEGAIALDGTAQRLCLPNLRGAVPQKKDAWYTAVGVLSLDALGLPLLPEADKALPTRPERLNVLRAAIQKEPMPGNLLMSHQHSPFADFPVGLGFVPINESVVILGGVFGPVTWNEKDRRGRFNSIMMNPHYGAPYVNRVSGHPTLPVVYNSILNTSWLFSMEHADGFVTLAPKMATLPEVTISSYPVVLNKRGLVALGGRNLVHLVAVDGKGMLKNERIDLNVSNPNASALAYSEKFDRLFVTVEKLP